MVNTYSKKKDGDKLISEDFRIREFACNDGSDTILIDLNLVKFLQRVRNWAKGAVSINSGYRTVAYNAKVGGASGSYHTKGMAADIVVNGKEPREVAAFLEIVEAPGILYYVKENFVHVDVRTGRYWANVVNGIYYNKLTFGGEAIAGQEKKEEEMTEKQVKDLLNEACNNVVDICSRMMLEILDGEGTNASGWFEKEFSYDEVMSISDGTRPGGYATREECIAMILRSKKNG